jgi:HAD superfamily hydrolase (TIGR01490 family)
MRAKQLKIFDVDDTIVHGRSLLMFIKYLVNEKIFGKVRVFRYYLIKVGYLLHLITPDTTKLLYLSLLKGMTLSTIDIAAQSFVKDIMMTNYNWAVKKIIEDYSERGFSIIFISGGLEIYLEHFGKQHNAIVIGTRMQNDGMKYNGYMDGYECVGYEKISRLTTMNILDKFKYENISVYSDSINDLPLFSIASHKVAVSPDNNLRDIAVKNNILILD